MVQHQPFLKPDFILADFSILTQIPEDCMAYDFRETWKHHFVDYQNRWLVNHAKTSCWKKNKGTPLGNIALQSGFPNCNTFLTAFKKDEGTSPHAFATRVNLNSEPSPRHFCTVFEKLCKSNNPKDSFLR